MKPKVLCADNDDFSRNLMANYLRQEMFQVIEAKNGEEAKESIIAHDIDILLLDLVLPDYDGISLMQQIKPVKDIPIIILSSKAKEVDRIVGIETGADDYLAKPFSPREVKARINAILRRASVKYKNQSNDQFLSNKIKFDKWNLDPAQYQAYDQNHKSANLTTQEFLIIYSLASSKGKILTRDHLFEITRRLDSESYDRAVDIQIARIRKKLGDNAKNPKYIKTVRGIGYFFCA